MTFDNHFLHDRAGTCGPFCPLLRPKRTMRTKPTCANKKGRPTRSGTGLSRSAPHIARRAPHRSETFDECIRCISDRDNYQSPSAFAPILV